MHGNPFPLAYRWFIHKGLRDWEPWYFCDTVDSLECLPDFDKNAFAARAFATETGADFEVYLFARRQDMDDFAFFVVKNGRILDKVVTIHLTFVDKLEFATPLREDDIGQTFIEWIRDRCLPDVAEWMDESELPGR